MEKQNKKSFNRRKFISIGLFFTLAILVLTAILIQVFEALKHDFYIHLFTVIHIFNGLVFTILSIYHIKINWNIMKTHFVPKEVELLISKEGIYAFCVMTGAILIGFLFVMTFLID